MVSLHKILDHPKGATIAGRFIERSKRGSSCLYVKDDETIPPTCCRHCQLTLQLNHIASSHHDTITDCIDLQYHIQHLMDSDLDHSTCDDTENSQQIVRPRFFTLSQTAQCNFISLLHHYIHQLPSTLLQQFITAVKLHLNSEITNMDWCTFLIQNLELKMKRVDESNGTSPELVEMKTAISEDTLEKVKLLASSFQASSNSNGAQGDHIQQSAKVTRITVSSVWAREEDNYSDIKTPTTSFIEGSALDEEKECVEVARPQRKRERLNEDEDHIFSSPPTKRLKVDEDDNIIERHSVLSPALTQSTTQASEVNHINSDVMDVVQIIWQKWLEGKAADEESFHKLVSLEQTQFAQILKHQVSKTPEALPGDAVPALVANLIQSQSDNNISYINAVSLLKLTVLPTIVGMGPSAHKLSITSALSSLLNVLPHQTMDGLLGPLMQDPNFVASQAVCRLVKDKMSEEQQRLLWRKLIDLQVNSAGDPYVWGEHTVTVAQALIIDKKISLGSHQDVEKLMSILSRSAVDLMKCVKFGCFVKDLCIKYSKLMSPFAASLLDIALSHKSSIKNLLLKTIRKMT